MKNRIEILAYVMVMLLALQVLACTLALTYRSMAKEYMEQAEQKLEETRATLETAKEAYRRAEIAREDAHYYLVFKDDPEAFMELLRLRTTADD